MRHALLELGDGRIQDIHVKTAFDVTAGNEPERHKVVALVAFGEVVLLAQFLESEYRLLVRRESRSLALLRKLLVQEPPEEHEQHHPQHDQHDVEPLRQARVIERVFRFQDIRLLARSAHGNLHGHRVGIHLHGIATHHGVHLLRRDEEVAAHEGVERCKPGEFGGALGHAFGHLFVLHFLDFETAEVSDKARQVDDCVFGGHYLDFVIEHVAHEHLGVIDVRLDTHIEGERRNGT